MLHYNNKKFIDRGSIVKLTRKEKKAKYGFSFSRNRKLDKFQVPEKDIEVLRRRKAKKYTKTLLKHKRAFKSFYKGESIIKNWMNENLSRFNVKPVVESTGGYSFEGIIKNVRLSFNDYNAEAMIDFWDLDEDEHYDQLVINYIGDESLHPQKGYYDGDRTDGVYTYFPTREELYANEVFEYLVQDCNKLLVPQNSLYILDLNGSTMGFIGLTDESDTSDRHVQRNVARNDFIDDCSDEVCKKLFEEDKVYRIIKYDLFDIDAEPLIRYRRHKRNDADA